MTVKVLYFVVGRTKLNDALVPEAVVERQLCESQSLD